MKFGSKSIRCKHCGKIIGWIIPNDKYHYGIQEVRIQLKPFGNAVEAMNRYYCCDSCIHLLSPYHRSLVRKIR